MKNAVLSKIKRQARSQRLHVLLMETGQTTNYQLYSVVSVKTEMCQVSRLPFFSTSFSSFLLEPRVFPIQQRALNSEFFGRREKAEEAPYSWLPKRLLGQCQLCHPSCRGLRRAPLPAGAGGKGLKAKEKGAAAPLQMGVHSTGLRIYLEVTRAGTQEGDK